MDATEFDAEKGLIYFSSGADGTMSIFHEDSPDKYTLVERVKTQIGARTLAVDRKTGRVYLSVSDFGLAPAPTAGRRCFQGHSRFLYSASRAKPFRKYPEHFAQR